MRKLRLAAGSTTKRVVAAGFALLLLTPGSLSAWEDVPDLLGQLDRYVDTHGGPRPLYAIRPPYIFTHNVGFLQVQITNLGIVGNWWIEANSAGWRGGEYLYAAGLWVGAKKSDQVARVSTAAYATEFLPPIDPEWTVYEGFEGMQGGNRIGFSTDAVLEIGPDVLDVRTSGANDDWNGGADSQIDEDFLNGLDDDGDFAVDEDFEAIGQQMFSCQYWDISPITQEINTEHEPLDLLVQQRSFAWATAGANEFIGLDYKIWNIGNETLNDVFIAFFVDGDAGPKSRPSFWVDDKGGFVSIDTLVVDEALPEGPCRNRAVSVDLAYVFDTPDIEINEEEGGTKGGDVTGFFGGMFLGHSVDPVGIDAPAQVGIRRAKFFSSSEPYPAGDPRNDFERYDLISGEGVPVRETVKPADYRYVISAGPFRSLPPDTFLTFQTAFVIGEGRQGMIENAIGAQLIYDGVWRDTDGNETTGAGGRETCVRPPGTAGHVTWDDPCDTTSTSIRIDWEGYCAVSNYVDNDCNSCTPSVTGAETLVNSVGTVAPAPPVTNNECEGVDVDERAGGDRRVVLRWDNLSELKADPLQKRILFQGYRIWRVEGWRRPVGSTGPAPEEWQLLTQIVKDPSSAPGICRVENPDVVGDTLEFSLYMDMLGNWVPEEWPDNLGEPCEVCPEFCWPQRAFMQDTTLVPLVSGIVTGDTTAVRDSLTGEVIDQPFAFADQYPVGYYTYIDSAGIKNGMIYFYDITAFSAWDELIEVEGSDETIVQHYELSGRPAAKECQQVVPTWSAADAKDEIYVVPNPYIQEDRSVLPWGWDLIPSDADPTGTRIAFTNLPRGRNVVKIYTLAGDLVQTLDHQATEERGTVFWNLVSRNGQDIVAGVYMFTVRTEKQGTKVGRFVVIR